MINPINECPTGDGIVFVYPDTGFLFHLQPFRKTVRWVNKAQGASMEYPLQMKWLPSSRHEIPGIIGRDLQRTAQSRIHYCESSIAFKSKGFNKS
jgi:hypothetical protein